MVYLNQKILVAHEKLNEKWPKCHSFELKFVTIEAIN